MDWNLSRQLRAWIMSQGIPGVADVRYVCKEDSQHYSWLRDDLREDGSKIHHSINEALDATVKNRNDVVLVYPGDYAESITEDLSGRHLLGMGAMPGVTQVKPTAGSAYTGNVARSVIKNLSFWSSSSTSPELPAFYATNAAGSGGFYASMIDNCKFMGGHASSVVGLQLGAKDAASVWESLMYSTVQKCGFYAGGSQTTEFITGISLFAYDSAAQQAKKSASQCHFFKNTIYAETAGIRANVNSTNLHGTVFEENVIRSHQNYGPSYGIYCHYGAGSGDLTAMVINNRICAVSDAIKGFKTMGVQGNIVSMGAGAPTSETGQ